MPNPANPQNFNRFGYVLNNPIRFNDPTGHEPKYGEGACYEINCNNANGTKVVDGNGKGGAPKKRDEDQENLGDIFEKVYDDWATLDAKCASSGNDTFNNAACLDYIAVVSQDLATIASGIGAAVTAITTIVGCAVGSEAGILPGCAAGYALGFWTHFNDTNIVESGFNIVTYLATAQSDFKTGDTKIDLHNPGQQIIVGEDTITATHTLIAGITTSEPFSDFAIDFYSSGYNHGYFCGMSTILDCFGP